MKRYRAPWSTSLVVITALSAALLIGVALALYVKGGHRVAGWLSFGVLVGSALFAIRGYTISPEGLSVHRRFWSTQLSLRELESVRYEPDVMRGSIRLFGNGGLFSFTGLFRNKTLGSYRAFVTDPHRTVVLRFAGRIVVLSPAEPEEFARELDSIRVASPSVTRTAGANG